MEKKIKCYYNKRNDENSYMFIYDREKFGILLRSNNKGDEVALVVTSEKLFFKSKNPKEYKEIPFRIGMKKVIAMMMEKFDGKFPLDAYGFSNIILEVFMKELVKVKQKKSRMPPIQCKGG